MEINLIGIIVAICTFVSIWSGHVMVRVIEYKTISLYKPILFFAFLGTGLIAYTFFSTSATLSASFGIWGVAFLWDALEFYRQEQRVKHGHAPANPLNPRHQNILQMYPSATTVDLLKREPLGRMASPEEAVQFIHETPAIEKNIHIRS